VIIEMDYSPKWEIACDKNGKMESRCAIGGINMGKVAFINRIGKSPH